MEATLQDEVVIDTASLRRTARARFFRGMWRRAASVLVLLVVWWVLSLFMQRTTLPGPLPVFGQLLTNLQDSDTYRHLGDTMLRVLLGMIFGVTLGIIVGITMGLSKLGEDLLDTWVLILFTIPALVYGMLCILWFGLNDRSAVIAITVGCMPQIAINIWQGTKAIDQGLIHMGQAFRLGRLAIIVRVVIPQLIPFILAALRSGLGIAWKIVTVVELIGLSSGVGYMLNFWFGNFSMIQVIAWTITFTITLLIIEFGILKPIEARLTRWRPVAQLQRGGGG
jgi:NitT/TauT family transport system permease protein